MTNPTTPPPADEYPYNRERMTYSHRGTGRGGRRRHLGKTPGPKPRFTVKKVIDTALELGISHFTLSSVARSMGIATSTLYRVVDSPEALTDLCVEAIAKSAKPPQDAESWQDILRAQAEILWNFMEQYEGLDVVIMSRPNSLLYFSRFFLGITQAIQELGTPISPERLAFAVDFVADTVVSTHVQISALRETSAQGERRLDHLREQIAQYDMQDVYVPDESWLDRGFFDQKIDFIISGLEAEISHSS